MGAIERAVPTPQVEIMQRRAARWQVLRDRSPLTPRAQNIHDPVHHFANVDVATVAAALGGGDQRLDTRPFVVSQVARVAQLAAVVTPAALCRPYRVALLNQTTSLESQVTHTIQIVYMDGH
jgi:hypothetical protein